VSVAGFDILFQAAFERAQLFQLAADIIEVGLGKIARRGAIAARGAHELHELSDLLDRESKIATAADECEAAKVGIVIHPVPAEAPAGPRQQTDVLVVADRRHAAARLRCQGADRHLIGNTHDFSP
jgi:hypothetical protein